MISYTVIDGGFHMAGKQVDATRQELFITLEYLIENCYDSEHTSKTIELTEFAKNKYGVLLDRRRANSILEFLASLNNSFAGILPFTIKKVERKPRYYIERTLFTESEIKKIAQAVFKDENLSSDTARRNVCAFLDKVCNNEDKNKILRDLDRKERRIIHSTRNTAEKHEAMDELIENHNRFYFRPKHRIKRDAFSNSEVMIRVNGLLQITPDVKGKGYIDAIGYSQTKGDDVCLYLPDLEGAVIININNISIMRGSIAPSRRGDADFEIRNSRYHDIDEMIDLYYEGGTGIQYRIYFKYVLGRQNDIDNVTVERMKTDYEKYFGRPLEYTQEEREETELDQDGNQVKETWVDLHGMVKCNLSSFKKWYWEHGWFEHLVVVEPKALNNRLLEGYIARFQRRLDKYGEKPEEREERIRRIREIREQRLAELRAARANRENNDGGN